MLRVPRPGSQRIDPPEETIVIGCKLKIMPLRKLINKNEIIHTHTHALARPLRKLIFLRLAVRVYKSDAFVRSSRKHNAFCYLCGDSLIAIYLIYSPYIIMISSTI